MLEREHIFDTLKHKQFVIEASLKLIQYLYDNNRDTEGLQLAQRCVTHDNSKFASEEMQGFLQLPKEGESMKDAKVPPSEFVQEQIRLHWKNNRHHPEFFDDYHEMTELDVMEMVCDWYARSLQHRTNFKEFILTRQENRFHFDEEFFEVVWKYCEIIDADNSQI